MPAVPCRACSAPLEIPEPVNVIQNWPTVSVFIVSHENPITCAGCGRAWVLGIGPTKPEIFVPTQVGVSWDMMEVPAEQQQRKVLPFSGLPPGLKFNRGN